MYSEGNRRGEPDKVLVLGSDSRSFLSVVRSLGRRGLEVHAAWCDCPIALRSKYLAKAHHIASPWQDSSWLDEFNELLRANRFALVIPCNDPSLIPLQENRGQLDSSAKVYLLDPEPFRVAFDKSVSTDLAKEIGIPVPASKPVTGLSEAEEFATHHGYPLILKPFQSYDSRHLSRRNKVLRVDSAEEMRNALVSMSDASRILVQQFFDGYGVGVEFLSSGGRVLFAFQHARVHEPSTGGGSSYRKSVEVDPRLSTATKKLVAETQYTGVGMVEFRVNDEAGTWIFVEINGRFWGSLPLAVAAGADFPWHLYELAVKGETDPPTAYKKGIYCRNLTKDAEWFREKLGQRGFLTVMKELCTGTIRTAVLRERCDTFTWDDPGPGIAEVRQLFLQVCGGLSRRMRLKILGSRYGRWRQKVGAVKALRTADKICFVCKGNICRSPFAERYARKVLPPGIEVSSAGYFPKANRPSPPNARQGAARFGVNLDDHHSRLIGDEVCDADVVFAFDEENLTLLRQRYPELRVYRLAAVHRQLPLHIEDPYGRSTEQFETVYEMIKTAIDEIASVMSSRKSLTHSNASSSVPVPLSYESGVDPQRDSTVL